MNELLYLKEDDTYSSQFSYFDTPKGIDPLLTKLPLYIRRKWRTRASKYKLDNGVTYPPLTEFAAFITETAEVMNDPCFDFEESRNVQISHPRRERQTPLLVKSIYIEKSIRCPIHRSHHSLQDCFVFKGKSYEEKRDCVKEFALCFKCLKEKHRSKECKADVSCDTCKSKKHLTLMHDPDFRSSRQKHGGENTDLKGPHWDNTTY